MFQSLAFFDSAMQKMHRPAWFLLSVGLLAGCVQQSPLVALGLQPGIKADPHTRLRFPAHTPVLIRFDATQAPEAWAAAVHQGVAMHFPKAQRQQTIGHGLEWFVRWPYLEPPTVSPSQQPNESSAIPELETVQLSGSLAEPVASDPSIPTATLGGGPTMTPAWYSLNGAKQRLNGAKRRLGSSLGSVAKRLPSPLFWRRDASALVAREPLPARIRGLAQVVVSDRNNGKILALADVQIDQSALLRIARYPKGQVTAEQRRSNNERQIAKAFAALAASLVASGDS